MSKALTALVLCLSALLIPTSASGVWGGALDTAHPQVGAMYYDYPREDGSGPLVDGLVCSGSYAGTKNGHDVFLLAGHCLPSRADNIDAGDLYVSFSNNEGVTDTHTAITDEIQVQQYVQMPGFGHDQGDLRDLAVLLLPQGSVARVAPTAAPVKLAPIGYLDALKNQKQLDGRRITIVGYGFMPEWGPAGPTTFAFDGERKSGQSVINGLGKAFVKFQQNNGIGTGQGICFGDSGSPQIDETNRANPLVISVTSGGNGQCNSINYNYRVDTPQARAFLGQYLPLP